MADGGKFWTVGFALSFVATLVISVGGGLYFLLISGLTEASNPIGEVFAVVGLVLLALPAVLAAVRYLILRRHR